MLCFSWLVWQYGIIRILVIPKGRRGELFQVGLSLAGSLPPGLYPSRFQLHSAKFFTILYLCISTKMYLKVVGASILPSNIALIVWYNAFFRLFVGTYWSEFIGLVADTSFRDSGRIGTRDLIIIQITFFLAACSLQHAFSMCWIHIEYSQPCSTTLFLSTAEKKNYQKS
jgi:hypothetical protein